MCLHPGLQHGLLTLYGRAPSGAGRRVSVARTRERSFGARGRRPTLEQTGASTRYSVPARPRGLPPSCAARPLSPIFSLISCHVMRYGVLCCHVLSCAVMCCHVLSCMICLSTRLRRPTDPVRTHPQRGRATCERRWGVSVVV